LRAEPFFRRSKIDVALLAALFVAASAAFGAGGGLEETRWVGSWAASQQLVEPGNALGADDLRDATLRQTVRLSIGGSEIRLRLSNRFGTTTLHLTAVHVAHAVAAGSAKIAPGSDKALTFSGLAEVTIPPHAEYLSDPIAFRADALSNLAITLHVDAAPAEETGHPGSRTTTYFAHGDEVSAADLPGVKTADHWYFIAGIDVEAAPEARAVVVLGDSITDGRGSTTNGNDRWTDVLADRLQAPPGTHDVAVLNQGIGGNHLLTDGLGLNALARFDQDAIAQPGARYVIVLEGINDIGLLAREGDAARDVHNALVRQIIAAYEQIIARAHAAGITAIGATMTPFAGSDYYHPGAASEADRQAVNAWIRARGHFDAAIDFDALVRDPEHPERMSPAFDSGDHLHPSAAGYAAMAAGVPLALFESPAEPAPKLAITFDDLPAHGPLPAGETRIEVISKIIAALRDAGAPPVYGFVNGTLIEKEPGDAEVLQAWRNAGNLLGNHTYSHLNLDEKPPADFERDILRDEPALEPFANDEDWRWFRYPFLAEGRTPEKKAALRSFLRTHGYKVAAVTMSFGDYLWNEPYARCEVKGDAASITALEDGYLAAAGETADQERRLSRTLYGRDIPYVLLMHVGAFDAAMLPRLLQLYRAKGFEFVTLPEAERDAFYRSDMDLALPAGQETLEDAMRARQLPLPAHKGLGGRLDSVCR